MQSAESGAAAIPLRQRRGCFRPIVIGLKQRHGGGEIAALRSQRLRRIASAPSGVSQRRWGRCHRDARQPHEILRPDWVGSQNDKWESAIAMLAGVGTWRSRRRQPSAVSLAGVRS